MMDKKDVAHPISHVYHRIKDRQGAAIRYGQERNTDMNDAGMPQDWSIALRRRIGKNMRTKRLSKGLTIYDVAVKTGISWHSIEHWETGKNSPKLDTLIWCCRKMDWKLSEIIGGRIDA